MGQFIRFFWIFMLGGFVGFLIETIWCMIRWKKIESRKGLIYGHFIPIYGLATLAISAVVYVFRIRKWYFVFLVTFFISGVVEYLSSLFQERVVGSRAWDYSDMKFNLNGRINLIYLIGFGIVGVLWCKICPVIFNFLGKNISNEKIIIFVTMSVFIFMIYNCFISLVATVRQKDRRNGVEARNRFEIWVDNKYTDEYLKKVYANAVFVEEQN